MLDRLNRPFVAAAIVCCASGGGTVLAQSFVNWESPQSHPIEITPDGTRLLVVNTADNRLEIFAIFGGELAPLASIPVGLDPVSVRALDDDEAWVVNHISDTISVVDLAALEVVATLRTGDEPADVVFAGNPLRAFVSVSQENRIAVYDPANLAALPVSVAIAGEDPRALATDGATVYAAIFESGNRSTILPEAVVASAVNPYPGDPNPPPNAGSGFDPPIAGDLPGAPDVSHIVTKQSDGTWRDGNGGDWSAAVTWNLHDHDLAMIDATSLAVTYATGLMNINAGLAVSPAGDVLVVGTEALNHIRFEPNLGGRFVTVMGALVAPPASVASAIVDLNPHLDYSTPTVSQGLRDESIGDPRGAAWNTAGDRVFVAGMGSNNLLVLDANLDRVGLVEVGAGPTGVAVDDARGVVYVLDRFEGAVSIVDQTLLTETHRETFFDPTPTAIKTGRPHLYGTHETSGLGHLSCASCHVDGRMDQVAWDLGDPNGEVKEFNQVCNFGILPFCEDWHPMKGPMATQTLVGIVGTEPFHWRGDREELAAFNPAFESLLGDDEQLTGAEMAQFEAFVATLRFPPNPNRNIDGTLRAALPNGGSPATGQTLFNTVQLDTVFCVTCHAMPSGTNGQLTSANLLQEAQSMKIPQLRNMHEKTGFSTTSSSNNRGFGFIHDGSVPSLFEFLQFPGFNFAGGATGDQQRRDIEAFLFSFAIDTHAGVGVQATRGGDGPDLTALRNQLITIANGGAVGLVAKGMIGDKARGYRYMGSNQFQSDRAAESVTTADLDAAVTAGAVITWTLVPAGSQTRIGIDRDGDGFFDRDEIDACSNPADAASVPSGGCACPADFDETGDVGFGDLTDLLIHWGACPPRPAACPWDLDSTGDVGFGDLTSLLIAWGSCS